MTLTKNELEVMNILWGADIGLSSNDITNMPIKQSWKSGSIFHILNRLLEKEVIIVVGIQSSGKVFGRTYAANITRERYLELHMQSKPQLDKVQLLGLFSALLKDNQLTNEVVDDLEQILADIRKDLPKS